jgi:hypothetical protein
MGGRYSTIGRLVRIALVVGDTSTALSTAELQQQQIRISIPDGKGIRCIFTAIIHKIPFLHMSSLLAIHFDAIKVIVLSIVIIWAFTVISILFGLNIIKKIFSRNS